VWADPLGAPNELNVESTLVSIGDPRKGGPSRGIGSTARFELNVPLSVRNKFDRDLYLLDIKAQVYHVSMYRLRLADMLWAPRVELAIDNTTNLQPLPERTIPPGQSCDIHLVFETSVFDTLFTTIVSGLIVQCSRADDGDQVVELPSDRILIFQHDHHWNTERAHFVARNLGEIDEVEAQSPSHRDFFESLRRIYRIHTGEQVQSAEAV
jgi:hypothetical protein